MRRVLFMLFAATALGATGAIAQPRSPEDQEEQRHVWIEAESDEESGEDEMFAWFSGDESLLDQDEMGGGEGHKVIVRKRMGGPGMGGMQGMHGGHGMKGRSGGKHAMMMAKLDLSDAQRTRMRELHVAAKRKSIQAGADLQLAKLDLHQLMQQDKPQRSAIDAQIDKLARLKADQHKARVGTMLEAKALLTPEQQKKMKELHQQGGHGDGGMKGRKVEIRRSMDGHGGHGGDSH